MSTPVPTFADRVLIVLATIGASVAATLLPLLGSAGDIGSASAGDLMWFVGSVALGAALVFGLLHRDKRPNLSTALLVVGSLAPSVAWYWLPPMWLLSIGIAAAALISARGRSRPVTAHA